MTYSSQKTLEWLIVKGNRSNGFMNNSTKRYLLKKLLPFWRISGIGLKSFWKHVAFRGVPVSNGIVSYCIRFLPSLLIRH